MCECMSEYRQRPGNKDRPVRGEKKEGLRERCREVIDMKACKGMLGVGVSWWIRAWGPGKEGERNRVRAGAAKSI